MTYDNEWPPVGTGDPIDTGSRRLKSTFVKAIGLFETDTLDYVSHTKVKDYIRKVFLQKMNSQIDNSFMRIHISDSLYNLKRLLGTC